MTYEKNLFSTIEELYLKGYNNQINIVKLKNFIDFYSEKMNKKLIDIINLNFKKYKLIEFNRSSVFLIFKFEGDTEYNDIYKTNKKFIFISNNFANGEISICTTYSNDNGLKLNSFNNKPSRIDVDINGNIIRKIWSLNGEYNRENDPAIIEYKNNKIFKKEWYVNGNLHRIDGPAIIRFDSNENIIKKAYFINGESIENTLQEAIIQTIEE